MWKINKIRLTTTPIYAHNMKLIRQQFNINIGIFKVNQSNCIKYIVSGGCDAVHNRKRAGSGVPSRQELSTLYGKLELENLLDLYKSVCPAFCNTNSRD